MSFGSKLRELRLSAALSQGDLALRAGVSRLTIVRIEAQQTTPTYRTVRALAGVFGLPPRDFQRYMRKPENITHD
jgi:transcriptional regulator with XRE-family HTH domain